MIESQDSPSVRPPTPHRLRLFSFCPSSFLPTLRDSRPISANALVHLHSTGLSHRHFFYLRSNRFPPLDPRLVANFSIGICVSEVCVLEQIHDATSLFFTFSERHRFGGAKKDSDDYKLLPMRRIGAFVAWDGLDALRPSCEVRIACIERQELQGEGFGLLLRGRAQQRCNPREHDDVGR
jgi:hypothetical protein